MAGDWLKMEHELADKPEVIAISATLGIDRFSVIGRLHRIWSWFDRHTTDGCAAGVTTAFLDSLVAHEGFAQSMTAVGWLAVRNGRLSVPNFDRHISKSAKQRNLASERMKRSRYATSATKAQPEKRREEKKDSPKGESPTAKFVKPTVSEVAAYCIERTNGIDPQRFVNFYESKGWKVGGQPMKDWRAAVRTWEGREDRANGKGRKSAYVDPSSTEAAEWSPFDEK